MVKRMRIGLLLFMVALFSTTMSGCATVNSNDVAQGKHFQEPFYGFADNSLPIEEQCILINLAENTIFISAIDGKTVRIPWGRNYLTLQTNFFAILPPGEHEFTVGYQYATMSGAIYEGSLKLKTILIPGEVYILTGFGAGGRGFNAKIERAVLGTEIEVYGEFVRSSVPMEAVISGINAKIAKSRNQ